MFEPQDHPDDFNYEGGPPNPPYDNAGYTLAFQMGIEFDRIFETVDGPFEEVNELVLPAKGKISGPAAPAGYMLDHAINDAAVVMNRLLAAKQKFYWTAKEVTADGKTYPAGTIYIPSSKTSDAVVAKAAGELGVGFIALKSAPQEESLKINPVRIGLWDRYGGSMQSGWTRFILEQFEFPFELVFPKRLNEGNLNKDFDVLVFVSGAIPSGESRMSSYQGGSRDNDQQDDIPEEYRDWLGSVTTTETLPKIIEFINNGGTVIAIGSSTSIASHAGLPISDHIVDGKGNSLSRADYYVPASILQVKLNNTLPIAYGMNDRVDVFFDNSPVFRLKPEAGSMGITPVAWFDSDRPLRSGWAWGQDRLYGGVTIAEADMGKGKIYLFGPEILFRGQPHGTFKLFFNGLYLSASSGNEKIK